MEILQEVTDAISAAKATICDECNTPMMPAAFRGTGGWVLDACCQCGSLRVEIQWPWRDDFEASSNDFEELGFEII